MALYVKYHSLLVKYHSLYEYDQLPNMMWLKDIKKWGTLIYQFIYWEYNLDVGMIMFLNLCNDGVSNFTTYLPHLLVQGHMPFHIMTNIGNAT